MRGTQKPGAVTLTSPVRGIFQVDGLARGEAISLILGKMTKGSGRQTTMGGYDSYQQMAAVAAVQLDKTLVTLLAARRRRGH
jgi:hypothetical protein